MELRHKLQLTLGDSFRIERELAAGGMSRVFLALDKELGRRVVVKTLAPDLIGSVSVERFRREIRVAASLQQANIVPVHSAGDIDGLPYYTMPFVEGQSLRDYLAARGVLPAREAVSILRDVARALSFAHERGVIHRDIKPENVLLSGSTAVVTDFGIAKAIEASRTNPVGSALTQVGAALGTPAYMSPEQITSDPDLNHLSDIYALGVLAYELLTGSPPFTAPTIRVVLAAHLTRAPTPVAEHCPDAPHELSALIMDCLAKDPAARPRDANAVLARLEDVHAPGSVAPPASAEMASLVVVPFANMSAEPDTDYFSDGLTEEIMTDLSQVRALKVISRNSAMRLKGTTKDAPTIGRELGVRYVLQGGVRKAASSLRITAQLVDTATDAQVWAEKFSGSMDDVFDVQERVSRGIVGALGKRLTHYEERSWAERAIKSPEAYVLYLKARNAIWRPSNNDDAFSLIDRAIALDGETPALLGLRAVGLFFRLSIGTYDPSLREQAANCAKRVLSMAPDSVWGHFVAGYLAWNDGDLSLAARHFKLLLGREPNNADALAGILMCYVGAGKHHPAHGLCDRFIAADPFHPHAWIFKGAIEWFEGDFETSRLTLGGAVEMFPEGLFPRWQFGYALALGGHLAESAAQLEIVEDVDAGSPYTMQLRALLEALRGDAERAVATLDSIPAADLDGHLSFHLAESFAAAGAPERALSMLQQAIDKNFYPYNRFFTEYCPFFKNLRSMSAFQNLVTAAQRRSDAFSA